MNGSNPNSKTGGGAQGIGYSLKTGYMFCLEKRLQQASITGAQERNSSSRIF